MGESSVKRSSWTPVSNPVMKEKIFQERKDLISQWFKKWSTSQRASFIEMLLDDCLHLRNNKEVLGRVQAKMSKMVPVEATDVARALPRCLVLHIFSYLDPRSLCRTAQVCWYWKMLAEMDCLWAPKCIKLGWVLPSISSPHENGAWKRFYVSNVLGLQKAMCQENFYEEQRKHKVSKAPKKKQVKGMQKKQNAPKGKAKTANKLRANSEVMDDSMSSRPFSNEDLRKLQSHPCPESSFQKKLQMATGHRVEDTSALFDVHPWTTTQTSCFSDSESDDGRT
eukprot:m.109919 g.109919  ORF g.109919 m.109919 type:complete len:281 (+) comp37380_c0_seq2:26-868(+)